jgi:hypothetical protein
LGAALEEKEIEMTEPTVRTRRREAPGDPVDVVVGRIWTLIRLLRSMDDRSRWAITVHATDLVAGVRDGTAKEIWGAIAASGVPVDEDTDAMEK